jgi:hypothetical protein
MNKEFVPHEPSLALKELGFDEPCFGWYSKDGTFYEGKMTIHQGLLSAPLYQQAFRWFREKYDLKSFIQPLKNDDDIDIYVFAYGIEEIEHNDLDYLIYEEAELACLGKLIEIVKQKQ